MTGHDGNRFGGSWTERKLEILESYLKAYTTALKRQDFHLTYVDAFAGTGYVTQASTDARQGQSIWDNELDDPTRGILQGSARRALAVADKPFDSFVFVEQNRDYAGALRRLQEEFPNRDITVAQADANFFLQRWCERRNRELSIPWRGQRAVVFLDPFATQVDWQTVQAIAETRSVDLWILFPVSALTRILPRAREPDAAHAANLDRVYGGTEWWTLYQTKVTPTLFGDAMEETLRAAQRAIVAVYLDKLRSTFHKVAPSPKWFHNSRNSPLFALMFAASNPKGAPVAVKIANHLLERW